MVAGLERNKDLGGRRIIRSEEHTSELQSHDNLVCRLLLEKKKKYKYNSRHIHQYKRLHRHFFFLKIRAPPKSTLFPYTTLFNDTATTEIYTLSLHDALPISVVAVS